MADTPQSLAERLATEGQKTREFFAGLSDELWDTPVYPPGDSEVSGWSIRQLLAHFVSAEASFQKLIGDVVGGGKGVGEDFNIDFYNGKEVRKMNEASPAELLDRYQRLRSQLVEQVQALNGNDLEKQGRHPFLGVAPVVDMIKLIYRHNQIHLRDVRRLLQAPG